MLVNILYGLIVMGIGLFLQSLLIVTAMRYYLRRQVKLAHPSFWAELLIINSVMLLLVFGNIVQVIIWAVLFQFLGEFSDFREAVYHSAVNFTTLGYGDIVMSAKNELLGPLEAINGVLMIGLSTAALMAVLQDALKRAQQSKKGLI